MVAAKAYELFNSENVGTGLEIRVPETIKDVNKNELRLWVNYFGGHAVIKIPYSNAGQGVYTITSEAELDVSLRARAHVRARVCVCACVALLLVTLRLSLLTVAHPTVLMRRVVLMHDHARYLRYAFRISCLKIIPTTSTSFKAWWAMLGGRLSRELGSSFISAPCPTRKARPSWR